MLWDLILTSLRIFPLATVRDKSDSLQYSQLLTKIISLSDKITTVLRQGYKCAILCKSELNTGICFLACLRSSITAVPLSYRYGKIHCEKILKAVSPQLILTDNELSVNSFGIGILNISTSVFEVGLQTNYDEPPDKTVNDVATIMYTSGTTGSPKGVMLTQNNILCNLMDIDRYFELNNFDKILISRPIYHAAVLTGEFLISLYKGINIFFYIDNLNPVMLCDIINEYGCNVTCITPTILYFMLKSINQIDDIKLDKIAVSGECMTPVVAELISQKLPKARIYNIYGLTEASPRVSWLPPEKFRNSPQSVGIPLKSVKVKIVDDDGNELSFNKTGELIVNGPNVMKGYYRNAELTAKTLRNGWLHTNDLACMDESGLIYIKSRKDNMIIRAGMNIYPQEIESVLKESTIIKDVLAYGVVDHNIGQKIHIDIVSDKQDITKQEIMDICINKLPSYQWPDCINIVNHLEYNGTGKLVRKGNLQRVN